MSYCFGKTIYPEGLAAPLLDSICRHTLWQHGLDYRHGTGHGVGFALNVHEGPQVLSYYAPIHAYSKLREGMILSTSRAYTMRDNTVFVLRIWLQTDFTQGLRKPTAIS